VFFNDLLKTINDEFLQTVGIIIETDWTEERIPVLLQAIGHAKALSRPTTLLKARVESLREAQNETTPVDNE